MSNYDINRFTGEFDIAGAPVDPLLVKGIQFDTADPTSPIAEGLMRWNAADGVPETGLPDGVTGQHFLELFMVAQNDTGATLPNGSVATYAGSIGNSGNIRISNTVASSTEPIQYTIGILTHDIENGNTGKVTTFGKVRGIQTDGANYGETWANGDVLYKSSTIAGGITNDPPDAPIPAIRLGVVISAHATNGTLLVRPTLPTSMQMLSDVDGITLDTDGQFPSWHNTEKYFDFDKNINSYVPYTGATTDVDLGTHALTTTGKITGEMAKVQAGEPALQVGNLWLDPSETAVDTTDHAQLTNKDYASSGHTGFEPTITAGTSAQFLKGDKSLGTTAMTLVDTASPSAAANFTFSNLEAGTRYKLVMNLLQNTNTSTRQIQFNADSGNNYYWQEVTQINGTPSAGHGDPQSYLRIGISIPSGEYAQHEVTFQTVQGNENYTIVSGVTATTGTYAAIYNPHFVGGIYKGAASLSSITILAVSGTMTGTAKLYRLN